MKASNSIILFLAGYFTQIIFGWTGFFLLVLALIVFNPRS
jgi:hypothetical protein